MKKTKKLKICFLNPMRISTYPPLNLTYPAAYLRKYSQFEYEMRLVDFNCSADPVKEIIDFNPDVLGVTTLSSHLVGICEFSSLIRKLKKDILLVCGGAHATISPQDLLNYGAFDIAVMGEGELTFKELTEAYIQHDGKLTTELLKGIKGIAFKDEDNISINSSRELINDLDTIPHPERDLLNNNFYRDRYYIMRGMNTYGINTIAGSRGCPYNCIFCCVNFSTFNKVRFHSVRYIADEIEELSVKYKSRWIFFTDDTFLINKKMTSDLCDEIIKRGLHKKIKWECQVRSNLVSWQDLALLKLMKKAGCEQIDYGFESGNQRVLALIKGKGITMQDNERAMDVTNKAKIKVFTSFILGTPTETYDELMDTKNFIIRNFNKFHSLQVTCMIPYPGTPVYDLCVERGLLSRDYFKELKNDLDGSYREGLRVFSDTIDSSVVLKLRMELDSLSFRKVGALPKINWLFYNLVHNRGIVKNGINWVVHRALGKAN